MAKKTRRARLSPTQRYMPTPGAPAPAGAPEGSASTVRPAARPGRTAVHLEQNPEEYAHIRADLQRIGILAGSILAVLVALRLLVFR
jgi:hypothetical protein